MKTLLLPALAILLIGTGELHGKANRVFQMPNGNRIDGRGCINCHTLSSPLSGNAALNSFGLAVESIVNGVDLANFWTPGFAALDSDGDGFPNGDELGDANGDGFVERITAITNPGDNGSSGGAGNAIPAFTSTPVLSGAIGAGYFYRASASDVDGDAITFSKQSGPAWLSVIANGAVSGTPPTDAVGVHTVVIKAEDDGTPPRIATQTFSLTVGVSFAGWQNLNFSPTTLQSVKGPLADPDDDGISNFQEYAMNLNPVVSNAFPVATTFTTSNELNFVFDIRDDDPELTLVGEFSGNAGFSNFTTIPPVVTDPVAGDQMKRLTITDVSNRLDTVRRFVRFRISNGL